MPQGWKYAAIEVLHKKGDRQIQLQQLQKIFSRVPRRQGAAENRGQQRVSLSAYCETQGILTEEGFLHAE